MYKLIFVYNAESGLFNKVTDFAHKIISPSSYNCSLCSITYGNFGIHKEWADFIKTLTLPVQFLYKNDFLTRFPDFNIEFPSICIEKENHLNELMDSNEIKNQKNSQDLIKSLREKLKTVSV